MTTSEKLI